MDYVLEILGVPRPEFKRAFSQLVAAGQHLKDHFIPHARNNYHPHMLGHRALALFSGLLVAVKIFTVASLAWGPAAPTFASAITVANIISLTNQSRQQNGETALAENSQLDQAAQNKADDMLAKGYFAHVTPDGRTPWSFIVAAGYNYLEAGENLAVNFSQAEDVETAWMNSPGHRANILNKDFQDIGIGISQGQYQGHDAIFVVQEFGTPAQQQITLSSQPSAVQTAPVPAPAAPMSVTTGVAAQPEQIKGAQVSAPQPAAVAVAPAAGGNAAALNQYQTLNGDNAGSSPASADSLSISGGQVELAGGNAIITANVSGPAAKVTAYFGQQAVLLSPQADGSWSGSLPLGQLAQNAVTVKLVASDMQGNTAQLQLADFAPSTASNYNPLAAPQPAAAGVAIAGLTFNPKTLASNFYLLFIATLLSCLVLAIAIKRHIQHLPLIANTAFVIILAVLMWRGG